jgi:HSP20 family protein
MKLPVRRKATQGTVAPHEEFDRLREPFVDQFDRWPEVFRSIESAVRDVLPAADVEETDEAYLVDVELPGVQREDVTLELAHGTLVVTGERRERERVGLLRHRTRSAGRFRLEVTLPTEVDADRVTASLDHGVLTVTVPKAASARRRRIPVSVRSRE